MTSEHERLRDIDIGKGIAIVLVVAGHLVAREAKPDGNDWYLPTQIALYSFHMAFFFYLAGYVFWTAAPQDRARRVRSAASRMLPAYLLMAVCGFVAKLSMARFASVGQPATASIDSWLTLVMYPTEGFVAYLWFIVALLTIYVIVVALLEVLDRWPHPLVWLTVIALVMHRLSLLGYVTSIGAFHYAMMNWIFFVLGYWTLQNRALVNPMLRRWWPVLLVALLVSLVVIRSPLRWTVPALLALPALHGLALRIAERDGSLANALSWLGMRSWPIYLLNTFALGICKAVLVRTIGLDDTMFIACIPLLLAAGLLLPIVVQTMLFSRIRWVDRFTR